MVDNISILSRSHKDIEEFNITLFSAEYSSKTSDMIFPKNTTIYLKYHSFSRSMTNSDHA